MNNRLYFGRVAPIEAQKDQVEGKEGWSWRYKVRIFDKHPDDKQLLPDEELPWAQVLLPVTAGSGAANYATTPQINQGDTVAIAYYDDDEQQPIITGVLPRTKSVSQGSASGSRSGYQPTTGFTPGKPPSRIFDNDETNEANLNSQTSPRSDRMSGVFGDTMAMADSCDPNERKVNSMKTELNNLFNQVNQFAGNVQYVESLVQGSVDRIHSITNEFVGSMVNKLFEALIPVLNAGLKALYNAVYAAVLAATSGNALAARLAAEAALIAFKPAIMALQQAIQIIAAQVVAEMFENVDALVRDAVIKNRNFGECSADHFVSAIINSLIYKIDSRMLPLLNAVIQILSGGFNAASTLSSGADFLRSIGGFFSADQGGNKCGGLIKQYAYGIGPKDSVGDKLDEILAAANIGKSISDNSDKFLEEFGDFPFMSSDSGKSSSLDGCSNNLLQKCEGPKVKIFGGRGKGAKAKATVGFLKETDDRRISTGYYGGIISVDVTDGGEGYVYPPFVEIVDECGLGLGATARAIINKRGQVTKIYIVTPGDLYPADTVRQQYIITDIEVVDGGINFTPKIARDQFGNEYDVRTGLPPRSPYQTGSGVVVERDKSELVRPDQVIPIIKDKTPDLTPEDYDKIIDFIGDEITIEELEDFLPTVVPPLIVEPIITEVVVLPPPQPPGVVTEVTPKPPVVIFDEPPIIVVDPYDPPIPPGGNYDPDTEIVYDADKNPVAPSGGLKGDKARIGRGLNIKPILTPLPSEKDVLDGNIPINLLARLSQEEILEIISCVES